jgi:hypothetical protein
MLAGKYKAATEKMLKYLDGKLEPRYMLSLSIIFDLYMQIYDRIDPDHGKFTIQDLEDRRHNTLLLNLDCVQIEF